MNSPKTTLYKDPYGKKLMGVCSGIADYTGINAIWVRLMAIGLTFASGGMTIPIYILMGLLLNKKPPHLYASPDQQQYWQRVRQNPKRSTREIRSRMRDVDRRLAEVESYYVNSNPRLSNQIEQLR